MEKTDPKTLKEEIKKCSRKLYELEKKARNNKNIEKIYNKVLVKKAVLVQKYKKLNQKTTVKDKIKKLLRIQPKKKLICDYFKTSVV